MLETIELCSCGVEWIGTYLSAASKGVLVEGLLIPTVEVFVFFNDDDGVNPVSMVGVRWSLEHSEQSKLQEINDHALEEW